ncbi:MAG: S9 family peptidase [Ignavibacterium sp.]|nr:S9 family peptidase [Ignavibacterium sp.]
MKTLKIALLFLFILISNGVAQDKRAFTAEDLWNLKRINSFTISPDKSMGIMSVSTFDIKDSKGKSDLYLVHLSGGEIRRLTTAKTSDSSPAWSPDNKKIAFISKREDDERSQLYIIPIDGGEAEQLTTMPLGISSPKWFPDGERIAFASNILLEFENDFDGLEKEIKKHKDSKVTAKVTENRFYRYWDSWLTDGYVTHIYSYNIATKERKDLTPALNNLLTVSGSGADYDISPDGKKIALVKNTTLPPYHDPLNFDIYLLNADGNGEMKNITSDNPGGDSSPTFSPDGKYLYYTRTTEPSKIAENTKLTRYDLNSGEIISLTASVDLSVGGYQVSPNSTEIIFIAEDRARSSVFKISNDGTGFKEILRDGTNSSLQVGRNKIYVLNQNLAQPVELLSFDLSGNNRSKLTSFNDKLLSQIKFGKTEEHYFEGAEGNSVQLFILYPPDFKEDKKWPMIHLIHGGPHGTFGDDFHPRWNAQLFAVPGFITVMVNFHGSTSFGEDFAQSIVGNHSDKPFTDIMKATDFLIKKYSFIDETRIGAAGGSYGGYLVNWIAGNTDRFAALFSHAGVYNLMGQFASDWTHFREVAYDGSPWDGKENLSLRSPSEYAKNFKTPMLIAHGEKDYRVVVTQGLEIYGVLQGKGIDSRLVYFPDENHWILSPQNSIFWYNEFHNWFDRYLEKGGK